MRLDENRASQARTILRNRRILLCCGVLAVAGYAVSTVVSAIRLDGFWTPWSVIALMLCLLIGVILAVAQAVAKASAQRLGLSPRRNLAAVVFALSLLTTLFVGMGVQSYAIAAQPTKTADVYITRCSADGRGDPACFGRWTVVGQSFEGRVPSRYEPETTVQLAVVASRPQLFAAQDNLAFVRIAPIVLLLALLTLSVVWQKNARVLTRQLKDLANSSE